MSTVIGLLRSSTEIQFHLISDSNEKKKQLIGLGSLERTGVSFCNVAIVNANQGGRRRDEKGRRKKKGKGCKVFERSSHHNQHTSLLRISLPHANPLVIVDFPRRSSVEMRSGLETRRETVTAAAAPTLFISTNSSNQ